MISSLDGKRFIFYMPFCFAGNAPRRKSVAVTFLLCLAGKSKLCAVLVQRKHFISVDDQDCLFVRLEIL